MIASIGKASGAMRMLHRPRLWLGVWLAMIAAVCVGSLLPAHDLPNPPIDAFDKFEHVFGYGVLSAYSVLLFARWRDQWCAALGLLLLGIALEIAQATWTSSRSADAADVIADLGGILLGLAVVATPFANALQRLDARLSR